MVCLVTMLALQDLWQPWESSYKVIKKQTSHAAVEKSVIHIIYWHSNAHSWKCLYSKIHIRTVGNLNRMKEQKCQWTGLKKSFITIISRVRVWESWVILGLLLYIDFPNLALPHQCFVFQTFWCFSVQWWRKYERPGHS